MRDLFPEIGTRRWWEKKLTLQGWGKLQLPRKERTEGKDRVEGRPELVPCIRKGSPWGTWKTKEEVGVCEGSPWRNGHKSNLTSPLSSRNGEEGRQEHRRRCKKKGLERAGAKGLDRRIEEWGDGLMGGIAEATKQRRKEKATRKDRNQRVE
jgi:hypothetical protein